jgi:dihydrolipoamide dehydrogenase
LGGITDPEVKASALEAFGQEFNLQLQTEVREVHRIGDEVEVRYANADTEVVERFDYILMATGRRPNTRRLDLHNTSVVVDKRGVPVFDEGTLQLGSSAIFIAGDVNGDIPLLHEAADDGRIAGENAARFPDVKRPQRRARLSVVFTDPQIAHIGVHFKNLPKTGVVIGAVDFKNQGRSRVILKNRGKLRVYADKADGRFLGAEMAGPSAEHIGHLLAWAVQQKMTIPQMLEMPFYHPVIEEGLRTALREAAAQLR